jgi:predicted Zn finger-like uncharacterized protein
MSFLTSCPACGTTFRAQREQLAARGGQVRCGRCGTVFNGIAALIDEAGEPLGIESRPAGEPVPEFLAERVRHGSGAWAFAAGLALLVLAGQVAYRYRNELAAYVPAARGPLREACTLLDCEVKLPRRPDLMTIESSDLQADPRRENVIVLNAVLRNRAPYPQEYPALELTLTDPSDRPVVRRVLAPQDYLDRAAGTASPAQGLGSGAELAVRLYFDAGRTRATGYRLYLFYP